MNFIEFARSHGLIIDSVIPNRWVAVPTEDHPRKRNGRYKNMGSIGWVQNWATMQSPAVWKGEEGLSVSVRAMIQKANKDRQEEAKKAAAKAGWILHQCKQDTHPYLASKGFPEEVGNVWEGNLVIPMRANGKLVGCQIINDKGEKKFLKGQTTKGAAFVMDAKGVPIFVEGFATALSVRAAMKLIKIRYTIYCCFSASNMEHIARQVRGGIVVCDNDLNSVGEIAARATGKPYWISDTAGFDFNDHWRAKGEFHSSQSLKKVLLTAGI
jgi:putative DNA primase/helicase